MAAGIVPPVNFMLSPPAASAAPVDVVSDPPQELLVTVSNRVMLPGAPAAAFGKISVTLTLLIAAVVGLVKVIVNVELVFGATVLGVKDLLTDGGGVTVRV